jgi:hypothetical protein
MNKKIFLILLLSIIFLSGCRPILISQDNPVLLEPNYLAEDTNENSDQDNYDIIYYEELSTGIVSDISYTGESLLLTTPQNSSEESNIIFNIAFYNNTLNQLTLLFPSEINQKIPRYANTNLDVYYLEEKNNSSTNTTSYSLIWSNYNGSITQTISKATESINPFYDIGENNEVIYTNEENNILISSVNEEKISTNYYLLSNSDLDILDIKYAGINEEISESKIIFFIAKDTSDDSTNLYYCILDNKTVKPEILDTNVSIFDVSSENQSYTYVKKMTSTQTLYYCDSLDSNNTQVIDEGNITSLLLAPDQTNIVYTSTTDTADTVNNQSIWISSIEGTKKTQIASGISLASNTLVHHPYKSIIYFSSISTDSSESPEYTTFQADYE